MKTNAWMASLVALACLLLAGCDYSVPLTTAATHPVNPALLGNWRIPDEKPGVLSVRQLDAATYIVAYDGDLYRAHHSTVEGRAFVSVQNLNDADRKYCYYLWQLSPGGAELTLRRVSTKIVPASVARPAEAQRFIAENLANPMLLEEPTTFIREQR